MNAGSVRADRWSPHWVSVAARRLCFLLGLSRRRRPCLRPTPTCRYRGWWR